MSRHGLSRRSEVYVPAVVTLASAVTIFLGYVNKARCAGPPFDFLGRSIGFRAAKNMQVCYSDIQFLWLGRDIDLHVFPFVHGGILPTGQLYGGAVEYPVLSGLLMWLGAIGAHTDAAFLLHSALILAPFGLLTAWLLGSLTGWRALWWALSPTLVLYAFHNWDLPAVATTVAAAYVMATPRTRWPLRTRGIVAAVLLAVGTCLKLYPGLFLAPLVLAVLFGRRRHTPGAAGTPSIEDQPDVDSTGARHRLDVPGALWTALAAVAVVVVANLPFAVLSFEGWKASFTFQSDRTADITTNSIWYWGLRPLMEGPDGDLSAYNAVVQIASPVLVVAAAIIALATGWFAARRTGAYPWLCVSGAMLCGFMLLHKVDSPQYALWLLPLLILVRVPWPLTALYIAANSVLGIAVFRYYGALNAGASSIGTWQRIVEAAVWSQAALLAVAFAVFLISAFRTGTRAPPRCSPHGAHFLRSPFAGSRKRHAQKVSARAADATPPPAPE